MATTDIQPGLDPPPGVESNFDNPDRTVQTWNIVTQSLCISLTTILFAFRIYCRVVLQKTVNIEDCESVCLPCRCFFGKPTNPLNRGVFDSMGMSSRSVLEKAYSK